MRVEDSGLKKFVTLYFSSTFILLALIFILIYYMQKTTITNLHISNMKNFSFNLSSKIINAHMSHKKLDFNTLKDDRYRFALYSKDNKVIFGDRLKDDLITITDKSPLGHLGVSYIKVQSYGLKEEIDRLKRYLIGGFIISYIIISIIGYYLSSLFMKPIKETRDRIDRFIRATTHEINTPITAIMMCANKDALKSEKNIQRLYISAKRVSDLYKDLTYLFLEDSSRKEKQILDLSSSIKEELDYYKVIASQKKITINCDLDKSKAYINQEDFKRLFSNLISNAIKYNKIEGSIDITLKNNILTIKDSGIGIERNKIGDIFKRYYRANSNSGGFGMGLSIVKKIADENGIKIDLSSKKGETTFILTFKPTT